MYENKALGAKYDISNTSLWIQHNATSQKCSSNSPKKSTVDWLKFTLKENIWSGCIAKKIIKIDFIKLYKFLIWLP